MQSTLFIYICFKIWGSGQALIMSGIATKKCVDQVKVAKLWEINNLLAIHASNICLELAKEGDSIFVFIGF